MFDLARQHYLVQATAEPSKKSLFCQAEMNKILPVLSGNIFAEQSPFLMVFSLTKPSFFDTLKSSTLEMKGLQIPSFHGRN